MLRRHDEFLPWHEKSLLQDENVLPSGEKELPGAETFLLATENILPSGGHATFVRHSGPERCKGKVRHGGTMLDSQLAGSPVALELSQTAPVAKRGVRLHVWGECLLWRKGGVGLQELLIFL